MAMRALVASFCLFAVVALMPPAAGAQTASQTSWGDPDLQGTYTNKTITPLERPVDVGDKEFLTDEEVAEQEQARLDLFPLRKGQVASRSGRQADRRQTTALTEPTTTHGRRHAT